MKLSFSFVLLSLLSSLLQPLIAQIQVKIEEMHIGRVGVQSLESEHLNHERDGPIISVTLSLTNVSQKSLNLHPSKSSFYLFFNFNDKRFRKEVVPIAYMDIDSLNLLPGQSAGASFAYAIFLGTPILSAKKRDFSTEVIETAPTIRVLYKEPEYGVSVFSNEIIKVVTDYHPLNIIKKKKR